MELKIQQKLEQPLLSRTKITAVVSFDKVTPSQDEVRATLAKTLGKDGSLISIEKIRTAFGARQATIGAYAYKSADVLTVVKKEGIKAIEKRKKQEEALAAKKAEEEKKKQEEKKPAEEKKTPEKEEKPVEEKKEE